jgi:N6-L-threonylcarbamoyladenine synthase
MRVLGIETSCDETGVALFEPGRGILAERLSSQVEIHAAFGGVVPELASRDHIAKLLPLTRAVLDEAGLTTADLDAVAYTAGPGLIGALLVGASFASSLAYGLGIPAVPVHHLEGHLLACMLETDRPEFPFLALLVSGGHSQLIEVAGLGRYTIIGETLDDAAGEAFDKAARMMGLGYPGGPAVQAAAEGGDPARYVLPRAWLRPSWDFSFSGLKTAVMRYVRQHDGPLTETEVADVCASFQRTVVNTLIGRSIAAARRHQARSLGVAGGVSANSRLRAELKSEGDARELPTFLPSLALSTDNAAMIAAAGLRKFREGVLASLDLNAEASLPL